MRIAIVYLSLRAVGGAENVVTWLAESLAGRGHEVVVFTGEYSEPVWGRIHDKPYRIHVLDYKKHRSTLRANREAGETLGNALSSYEFDVINPHNYPASLWLHYANRHKAAFPKTLLFFHNLPRNFYENIIDEHYGRLPGLRNIWNRHRPKKIFRRLRQAVWGYRRLDREAVLSCDRVIANSAYTAELAGRIYGIDVLPCSLGVSTDLLNKHIQGDGRINDGDRFSVLSVARIETQKNFDTILEAVRILKTRNALPAGFLYKIAGKGPQLEYCRMKCRVMGLGDAVQFIGNVPYEDIWKLYAGAEFLVHIPLDEPFGLVPLEAALFKKASIASDHGGPAEIVQNGITGLHADSLDPNDVADKIVFFLKHPDEAKKMGEAAHSWVLGNMTWEMFVNRFEGHLQQCVKHQEGA